MIVFDAHAKDFSDVTWDSVDWSEFHPDAVKLGEAIPSNAPRPRGNAVQLNMFCDASHATDLTAFYDRDSVLHEWSASKMVLQTPEYNRILDIRFRICRPEDRGGVIRWPYVKDQNVRYSFGWTNKWFLRQRERCA